MKVKHSTLFISHSWGCWLLQEEAVSLGFHKQKNKPLLVATHPRDSRATETVEVFGGSQKHQQSIPALARLSADPSASFHQPPVRVGWDLNLQPQAGARGREWETVHTCPPLFTVPIKVPKIPSFCPKLCWAFFLLVITGLIFIHSTFSAGCHSRINLYYYLSTCLISLVSKFLCKHLKIRGISSWSLHTSHSRGMMEGLNKYY